MNKLSQILATSGMTAEEISEKLSGLIEEFQGTKVDPPVSYTFDASQYQNLDEAKQSEDWPGDNEVLKLVNQRLATSAKAQAYQKATKPLKEAYEKSADFKRKNLIKAAVDAGFSAAEAEAMADAKLGKK